ncbi:MAG: ATP-binding protein [Candidatus Parvarchaeota archaeon]|nr:ATP-binding protein [Candidatus Parvarchaeota archaeon]MCW1301782.1 ATP-binding protein [Candidatus Parvarchaeota archaeon]
MPNNPFIIITSTENDKVVDRVKERAELQLAINDLLHKEGGLIVVHGPPGIGKSTIINWVTSDLKMKEGLAITKEEFNLTVFNKLKTFNIPENEKAIIILDDFNNLDLLDRQTQSKLLDLIIELSKRIVVILVDNREQGIHKQLSKLKHDFRELKVGPMDKEDILQMITDRLNLVRPVPSSDISPFTKEEIEKIYHKSNGNPRVVLLILSTLFDKKQEIEF